MGLNTINAHDVLTQLHTFDTLIDARSEGEFAQDHLPGALNWPTLNDDERHAIGTLYKQVNAFEAKKRGAAIAARNIARHIEREVIDKARDWRPLVYCWRGGKRSGSLALILDQIGFRVTLVEGGYKAFRAATVAAIPALVEALDFRVVCGTTGSGKTRLLAALRAQGAQVLDLEALANHRSSVLGAVPHTPQPTQKGFDTLVWDALRQCRPDQPVFVESESKKIGNVCVPPALMARMRASRCIHLVMPMAARVALLLEDYVHLVQNPDYFCERLDILVAFQGKAKVQLWKEWVRAGQLEPVVQALLAEHYDPGYQQSMQRNFAQFANAYTVEPADPRPATLQALALAIYGSTQA